MRTYSANFFGHGSSRFDARPPRQRSLNGNRQVASEHRQHLLRVTNREAAHDANVYKSIRNIAKVDVSPVSDLNAWTLLTPRRVVMTKAALDKFREQAKAAAKNDKAEKEAK